MVNAIGYCRVSTTAQNFDSQVDQVRTFCNVRAYSLLNVYTDKSTGSNTDRPGYIEMLNALDKNPLSINVVIVAKIDRLGRSLRDLLTFIDYLHIRNIDFISLGDFIDTSTPQGVLFLHIMSSLSEYERSLIRERTENGLKRYISAGGRMGAPVKDIPVEDIRKLLETGIPKTVIARKYKVSVQSIYNRLKK